MCSVVGMLIPVGMLELMQEVGCWGAWQGPVTPGLHGRGSLGLLGRAWDTVVVPCRLGIQGRVAERPALSSITVSMTHNRLMKANTIFRTF